MLSPVDTSSAGLYIFLELSRAALLSVVLVRRLLLPYVYTRLLARLASSHWFFSFKVYSNNLDICLRWILSWARSGKPLEGSTPFLRVLWLLNVSDVFGVGSKVVGIFYHCSHASWLVYPIRSPLGFLNLFPGIQLFDRLFDGTSEGY